MNTKKIILATVAATLSLRDLIKSMHVRFPTVPIRYVHLASRTTTKKSPKKGRLSK